MFNTTGVYLATRNSLAKIVVHQGGTSSSKTISILQRIFELLKDNPRWIATITGESVPNLKKGAYRDAEFLYSISPEFRAQVRFWNRSERIIIFKNGSLAEFVTNLDEQSAKSGKRDILFVNEAQGVPWPIFFQLALRTRRQIFIDYNPTAPFWVHDELIGTTPETNELSATVQLIISDHRHNGFLTEDEHRKIEGIKNKELWWVYARGRTGNLTGVIFPDWRKIPDSDFPWDAPKFGGQDFGYTNDPTAGVRMARVGESIFLHELMYTPGISPVEIKQIWFANGFGTEDPVYCEHDPDMIRQLRQLDLLSIAARKGQGSVNAGILMLNKNYHVYYTASSENLHMEKGRYVWINDPDTGKPTNTPIDQFNHLMDASRYGAYTHFYREDD